MIWVEWEDMIRRFYVIFKIGDVVRSWVLSFLVV